MVARVASGEDFETAAQAVNESNPQSSGSKAWVHESELASWMSASVARAARGRRVGAHRRRLRLRHRAARRQARAFVPKTFEQAKARPLPAASSTSASRRSTRSSSTSCARRPTSSARACSASSGVPALGARADEPGARLLVAGAAGPSHIAIRGARVHNLRDVDVRHPARPAGRDHRPLGQRQVLARLRHALRRGPAPLRRVALRLRAPVPRPDGEARRRVDRGALAGHRDRAEDAPRGTRAPRSAPSPRSTTTCACSTRASAARTAGSCGKPIASQSVEQMAERVLARGEGARVEVLAPVVRGRKGEYKKELDEFARQGFVRARIDGARPRARRRDPSSPRRRSTTSSWWWTASRCASRVRARIVESLETALRLADGLVLVEGDGGRELLSRSNACADCGVSFPELAPRLFSFNSPAGACERCDGLGSSAELDPAKLVPDPDRPLGEAIAPWGGQAAWRATTASCSPAWRRRSASRSRRRGASCPRRRASRSCSGTGAREIPFAFGKRGLQKVARRFDGVLGELERRREDGDVLPEELLRYARPGPCRDCGGARVGAPGAAREARRPRHPRAGRAADRRGARLPRRPRARRARARGGRPRAGRDPRAAALPVRRRRRAT